MQFSLPSGRRVMRFAAVFYVATALLFFGFNTVVLLGFFGTPSTLAGIGLFTAKVGGYSAVWPTTMIPDETTASLLLVGLGAAFIEPRVMEVAD